MRHSKQKGNLGFSSVLKELHKLGVNVFSEIGDLSKIDLIVEANSKLVKIQVKYANDKNGVASLSLRKAGPNGYRYTYTPQDIDVFAVYLPELDKVVFVSAKLACQNRREFSIRTKPATSGQTGGCHFISDFEDFFKAI